MVEKRVHTFTHLAIISSRLNEVPRENIHQTRYLHKKMKSKRNNKKYNSKKRIHSVFVLSQIILDFLHIFNPISLKMSYSGVHYLDKFLQ